MGVAVRAGVAEHHPQAVLDADPSVRAVQTRDADGRPGLAVELVDGRSLLIGCTTASQDRYKDGDVKVEAQKTRDSGAGRTYTYDQLDVPAARLFSATGRWELRLRWARDLVPWVDDGARIAAVQRIDGSWAESLDALVSAR